MNWDWAASLDHIWSSPNLPLYLTLATGGFVGIIVLITLLRSERSVANGVLALITLLAIGAAGAVTFRGFGTANVAQSSETRPVQTAAAPHLDPKAARRNLRVEWPIVSARDVVKYLAAISDQPREDIEPPGRALGVRDRGDRLGEL